MSGSHQIERPIAKPDEAVDGSRLRSSQWSTLASSAPRPRTTQTTPVAAAGAGLGDEHLAVGALVDALDLPDVDLDAGVLDLGDRAAHQLGAQLGVVAVGVAADRLELGVLGGHEQLEQELALVLLAASR